MTETDSNAHQGNSVADAPETGATGPEPDTETTAIELQARVLAGDLRDLILDQLRFLTKPWTELGEHEQRRIVERVSAKSRTFVRGAVDIIAHHEFGVLPVEIGSWKVAPGKGITLTITAPIDVEHISALANHGSTASLLLVSANEFLDARAEAHIDLDQPDLGLGEPGESEPSAAEETDRIWSEEDGRSQGEEIADEVRADAEAHVRGDPPPAEDSVERTRRQLREDKKRGRAPAGNDVSALA